MSDNVGERIARVETEVSNLGKLIADNHVLIADNHVAVTQQIKDLAKTVENGKLANYRIGEMKEKVDKLDQATTDLWAWREGFNGKIAMLLGVIGALVVAVQVVAAFL